MVPLMVCESKITTIRVIYTGTFEGMKPEKMTELHVPLWGENELKPWLQNKILVIFRECNGIGDSKFPMIIPVIAFPVPFTDCIPWGGGGGRELLTQVYS